MDKYGYGCEEVSDDGFEGGSVGDETGIDGWPGMHGSHAHRLSELRTLMKGVWMNFERPCKIKQCMGWGNAHMGKNCDTFIIQLY